MIDIVAATIISEMRFMDAVTSISTYTNDVYVSGEQCTNPDYETKSVLIPARGPVMVALLESTINEYEDTGKCLYIHLDPAPPDWEDLMSAKSFVTPSVPYAFFPAASALCPESDYNGHVTYDWLYIAQSQPTYEIEAHAYAVAKTFWEDKFSQIRVYDQEDRLHTCHESSFEPEAVPLRRPATGLRGPVVIH